MSKEVNRILTEREFTHGEYSKVAETQFRLMNCVMGARNWDLMGPGKRKAIQEIFGKIARIMNGDTEFRDHWVDIAGYASLVCQAQGENKAAEIAVSNNGPKQRKSLYKYNFKGETLTITLPVGAKII